MKVVLLVVCFAVAVAADTVNQQLLRALANIEKRKDNGENGVSKMTIGEFQHTLDGWKTISKDFIGKVKRLKPAALQALAGVKDWGEVESQAAETVGMGFNLYHTILFEAMDAGQRLFESNKNEGFGRAGRCTQMRDLVSGFDATDNLAVVKSTEALISDLDCLSGEVQDTIDDLSLMCADGEHFGVDEALGMIGRVMQTLFRFKIDGIAFSDAGGKIKQKYVEAYSAPAAHVSGTGSGGVNGQVKRLLSKLLKEY